MSRAVRQANADLDNPNDAAEDGVVAEGAEGMAPSNEALTETDFDLYFGVLSMQNLVVIRTYRGDEDDKVLQELKPRFVVMYDPMPAYIRRIEVSVRATQSENSRDLTSSLPDRSTSRATRGSVSDSTS